MTENYTKIPVTKLEDLLKQDKAKMKEIERMKHQHLIEHQLKMAELNQKLATLKASVEAEKQILEKKSKDVSAHDEHVKELEITNTQLLQENQELEMKIQKYRSKKKNPQDLELLDTGKKKFELHKEFTGIRWDYAAPENVFKGYVTNGVDYVKSINSENEKSEKKLDDHFWNEIYSSTESKVETRAIKQLMTE